jgi:hypothetical protein
MILVGCVEVGAWARTSGEVSAKMQRITAIREVLGIDGGEYRPDAGISQPGES